MKGRALVGICCVTTKFLSNVANSSDCAKFVTFDSFKFATEKCRNFQRRDWIGVKLSSQSRKRNFLTLQISPLVLSTRDLGTKLSGVIFLDQSQFFATHSNQ